MHNQSYFERQYPKVFQLITLQSYPSVFKTGLYNPHKRQTRINILRLSMNDRPVIKSGRGEEGGCGGGQLP